MEVGVVGGEPREPLFAFSFLSRSGGDVGVFVGEVVENLLGRGAVFDK
jgi:hypothetical protein